MKNIKGFVSNHKKAIKRVVIGGSVALVVAVLYKVLNKDNEEVESFEMISDEPVDVNYETIPVEGQE